MMLPAWVPPTLRTARLVVRPFTVDDLAAVHAYARAYPAATYGSWLGGTGPGDVARYIADTIARYGRPPRADLGIELGGRLIGGVAFRQVWISPPAMEVGWVLHPEATGRGIAREAVHALVAHLFEAFPEMNRIEARVRVVDAAGAHVLQALGFRHEGVLRYGAGEAGDAAMFGLLRAEWNP